MNILYITIFMNKKFIDRVKGVYMLEFSKGCLKFCLVILENC